MKQKILFLSFLLGASSLLFSQSKKDIVDYVNPGWDRLQFRIIQW